ncbi:MAG TPA: anti-sigma factor [Candidatus Limnocylindrales bacterium]|nr:anti-sigma factor [Candidatus Limnocylindrales bacterium]
MSLNCEDVRDLAAGYVLDALDHDEASAVRAHLASCTAAHEEVSELGQVVPHLAELVEPVEPPAHLRARLLSAASAHVTSAASAHVTSAASAPGAQPRSSSFDTADGSATSGPTTSRPWSMGDSVGNRAVLPSRSSPVAWLVAGLAALALVAMGAFTFVLQSNLDAAREYERGVAAVVEVAGQEGSRLAILTSEQPGGPRGLAAVGADGEIVIAMRDLPATTGEQVYEAWIIAGDGPPAPVGGFRVGPQATGTLYAVHPPPAEDLVLALTLEPGPGATAPSGPVVVAGPAAPPPS